MNNTLSLCVICKNEEDNIKNLLESVKGDLFDEVIVVDTGSTDNTVAILKEFENSGKFRSFKTEYFEWINDFSAARNYSFSKATSDYIAWLDSDDTIEPKDYKKLLDLKKRLHESPIWLVKYEYAHDEFGKSICSFYRERIVERSLNLKWQEPIHEYLPLDASFQKTDIEVHHFKNHATSDRNIPMLEDIVAKNPSVARNVFYLGKEYYDNGQAKKGIDKLKQFVEMPDAWNENKYNALIRIASYYKSNKDYDKAAQYCWKAIQTNELKADAYCSIGDIYMETKRWDYAIHWFKAASNMVRPDDALDIVEPKYHTWLPNLQLCLCYNSIGRVKEAAEANERALSFRPEDPRMLSNKKIFQKSLGKNYPEGQGNINFKDILEEHFPDKSIDPKEFKGKVGFFTSQNRNDGSNRIRILNIFSDLKDKGIDVEWFDPNNIDSYDFVITKSFSKAHIPYFKEMQEKGIKVILDYNEDITFDYNVRHMLHTVDCVIACSEELAKKVKEYNENVIVIEDAIEFQYSEQGGSELDKLQVFWFGYGGSSWMAEKMREMIEDDLGMKLVTIHEHPNADFPYSVDTVYDLLKKADIIIVPANHRRQPCKSNNRLTQAMAMSKPVICDPMPSYVSVMDNYIDAIMTGDGTEAEWRHSLEKLRDDPALRKLLATNGYEISKKFTINEMSEKWVNILISMYSRENKSVAQDKEKIDVVIPTKNNIDILDECLKSFKNSTLKETVYIIDNGQGVQDLVDKYDVPYEVKTI